MSEPQTKEACEAAGGTWNPETQTCKIGDQPQTKAECEAQGGTWNPESNTCILPPKTEDARDLLRQNEMLKVQLKNREDQLRQAIEIANRANDERKAKDDAEKYQLITSIQMDGKFSKDSLENKSLTELRTIRYTLDHSIQKTFASIAADMAEQKRRKKPSFTAGYWDTEKKTYVGGV